MASSPSFNSVDCSSLSLKDGVGSSLSERGSGLCRNAESLAVQAPIRIDSHQASCDHEARPFFLRSWKGMVISGFAIAATTTVGLSLFCFDGIAIAADLHSNSTSVVSVSSLNGNPNQTASWIENDTPNLNPKASPNSFPIISSNPTSDISLSIAIPIPHEQEWVIVRKGYIAPHPRVQKQESLSLKCPQWTQSELEMFLPDFNGRPKPFPRQGRHWFASYAVIGANNEAFLQLADTNIAVEDEGEAYEEIPAPMNMNYRKEEAESKLLVLKMRDMQRLTCFSM